MDTSKTVVIDYTNYRGERHKRSVIPLSIAFESNKFHPKMEWLLTAFDIDKAEPRTFAMSKIHSWTQQS